MNVGQATARIEKTKPNVPDAESTAEFLKLFAAHQQRILSYIFTLLPNEQDAQDVFQKVSLVLWKKFDAFDQDGDFMAWACGVAYYEVRNFLRVSARNRLQFCDELMERLADERSEREQDADRRLEILRECIKELPESEQRLLMQAYGEGRPIRELAEKQGKAPQTLYNRLNLIRRKLFHRVQSALAD
ncbi:sigma-70 family RNA polymerase sigma factor [Thermostilla marina]